MRARCDAAIRYGVRRALVNQLPERSHRSAAPNLVNRRTAFMPVGSPLKGVVGAQNQRFFHLPPDNLESNRKANGDLAAGKCQRWMPAQIKRPVRQLSPTRPAVPVALRAVGHALTRRHLGLDQLSEVRGLDDFEPGYRFVCSNPISCAAATFDARRQHHGDISACSGTGPT